jgi:hypothetical protein
VGSRILVGAASRRAAAEEEVIAILPASPVQYDPDTKSDDMSVYNTKRYERDLLIE